MSGDEGHNAHLIVVFHVFLFVLLGAFIRQIGLKLGLKFPAILMYFAGMVVGLYFVYYPDRKIFVLNILGPHALRTAYTPAYFFIGTFNMESEFIHKRALPHAVACSLTWVSTVLSISFACAAMSDISSVWYDYIIMAIIVFNSDLKIIKHFKEASHSFSSKEMFTLLELEGLIGSMIASLSHDLFLDLGVSKPEEFLSFIIRSFFACIISFFLGKFTASAIDRMHHDNVNQMTTIFTAIFFSYAGAVVFSSSGDLAVVTLSLALLGAKPGFSLETVTNVNRFVETYRYVVVSSSQLIGGMLFTISMFSALNARYLALSGIIYLILLASRYIIIIVSWLIFRKLYQLTFVAVLTICAFNIKSIFCLILTLSLISDPDNFNSSQEQLFILANTQIFMSTILTKPVASVMFAIQDNQTVKEKFTMVLKALERINECKDSTIKSCRCNQFTADADWSTVQRTAMIEKGFFKKFVHKVKIKDYEMALEVEDESRVKKDAINDMIRLQRRLLEEQFRHGTLSGRSAKQFAQFMKKCMHKSTLMSSQQVIDSTKPGRVMQIAIRDLIVATSTRHKKKLTARIVLVIITFILDVYLNVYATLSKMFMYTRVNNMVPFVTTSYSFLMGVVGIVSIFATGSKYLHTVNSSLWNWMAWLFTGLSFLAFAMDYFTLDLTVIDKAYIDRSDLQGESNNRAFYVMTMLAAVLVLLRSLILSCALYPVQYLLFRTMSSILHTCIYNQCDGCHGYLQVMMDTHKRLKNRGLDRNIERCASDIFHQESLAMRQFIGVMEVLNPEVLASLRTRIACRLVLMSQEKVINDLVEDGILEAKELGILTNILRTKHRNIDDLSKTLPEPSEFDLIKDIPWALATDLSYNDLTSHASIHVGKPGDILVDQGGKINGVIVILRGLVRTEINNEKAELDRRVSATRHVKDRYLIQDSCLDEMKFNSVELADFYTRGNVIGEFPLIINKPEHKTFRCVTQVKVMFIPRDTISYLASRSVKMKGPMNLLEYNMWTTVAIRQAARLILWSASYQLLTRCQVYTMMEEAYVLDCVEIGVHEIEKLHGTLVVLIFGEVICPITGMHYHGPVILPLGLIDAYWRRHSGFQKVKNYNQNIILVIPCSQSMLQGESPKPLEMSRVTRQASDTNVSMMTISSGSSDGIPYRHYDFYTNQR